MIFEDLLQKGRGLLERQWETPFRDIISGGNSDLTYIVDHRFRRQITVSNEAMIRSLRFIRANIKPQLKKKMSKVYFSCRNMSAHITITSTN